MISARWIGHLGNNYQLAELRKEATNEFFGFLEELHLADDAKTGAHAFYTIVGQKADFMLMTLRATMDELQQLEARFNKLTIADFTVPSYSYVSVVEFLTTCLANRTKIHIKIHMFVVACILSFNVRNTFASTQWTSVVKVMTTGICSLWKTVKI